MDIEIRDIDIERYREHTSLNRKTPKDALMKFCQRNGWLLQLWGVKLWSNPVKE